MISVGTSEHKCQECGIVYDASNKHVRQIMRANKLPTADSPVQVQDLWPPLAEVEPATGEKCRTTGGVVESGKLLCFGYIIRDTRNQWQKRVSPTPLKDSMVIYSEEHAPSSDWHCFEAHFSEFEEASRGPGIIERLRRRQDEEPVSIGRVTKGKRFDILKEYDYQCQLCGRTAHEDGVKLHVDHKVPKAKGGTNDLDNLWVLCKGCNLGKGTKSL